jgi:hypothetical protein
MVLFLDFDGVLHPEPCYDKDRLFCCLPRFENALLDFPYVEIVISSTWRETRTLFELRALFSPSFAGRIIGVTPSWKDHQDLLERIGYQRQAEIEAWLRESGEPWRPWAAIDDKPYLFKPFLPNLIKTNSNVGFEHEAELKLRHKLMASGI